MKRIRVDPWQDAGVRGMIVNMARRNLWKVAHWQDLDDLVQDGYMLWAKVRRRYPDVQDIKHLTALFQTTFSRYIIGLAAKKRAVDEIAVSQLVSDDNDFDPFENLGSQDEEQTVSLMIKQMPYELRMLWRFLNSEDGRKRLRARKLKRKNGVRETNNQFLCRVLGFDPKVVNLEKLAQQHFLCDTPLQRCATPFS